jgi:outer membrane lipoprotein SlyB
MKKFFVVLAISSAFVACRNEEKTAGAQTTNEALQPVVVEKKTETSNQPVAQEETVEKKKGMSKAAKGAIIGGVGGAVVGGVATKSAKGAVVGGVVGGTAGYIIGRQQDKKDGRVQ